MSNQQQLDHQISDTVQTFSNLRTEVFTADFILGNLHFPTIKIFSTELIKVDADKIVVNVRPRP